MVDEGIKVTCYSISFKSISMILNSENHGGLSSRGGSGARDAAIHRVLGDADGFVCSGSEGQWIATGYALAMTKVVFSTMKGVKRLEFTLCHCEEDRMDDAAIHRDHKGDWGS